MKAHAHPMSWPRLLMVTLLIMVLAACDSAPTPVSTALPTSGAPTIAAIRTPLPPAPSVAPTLSSASTPTAVPSPIVLDAKVTLQEYTVPRGSHPHDVAPARDGGVWYTAQSSGELGW